MNAEFDSPDPLQFESPPWRKGLALGRRRLITATKARQTTVIWRLLPIGHMWPRKRLNA